MMTIRWIEHTSFSSVITVIWLHLVNCFNTAANFAIFVGLQKKKKGKDKYNMQTAIFLWVREGTCPFPFLRTFTLENSQSVMFLHCSNVGCFLKANWTIFASFKTRNAFLQTRNHLLEIHRICIFWFVRG